MSVSNLPEALIYRNALLNMESDLSLIPFYKEYSKLCQKSEAHCQLWLKKNNNQDTVYLFSAHENFFPQKQMSS